MWDRLKKPLVLMLCVLLAVDTIPSLSLIVGEHNDISVQERMAARQDSTLISNAQTVTKQRLALMDESILGATGSWLVSDYGNPVDATFGAGREAANTSTNIVNLNKAFAQGGFLYVFDRCLELGDDSVLIKKHFLNNIIILWKTLKLPQMCLDIREWNKTVIIFFIILKHLTAGVLSAVTEQLR